MWFLGKDIILGKGYWDDDIWESVGWDDLVVIVHGWRCWMEKNVTRVFKRNDGTIFLYSRNRIYIFCDYIVHFLSYIHFYKIFYFYSLF